MRENSEIHFVEMISQSKAMLDTPLPFLFAYVISL